MIGLKLAATLAASLLAACSGTGGTKDLPASPLSPSSDGGSSAISAPVPTSPSDDQQLDTVRPTLRVTNATSSQSGTKTYEFQVADTSTFALTPGSALSSHVVVVSQSGVPEGGDGTTSFVVGQDLTPVTRYYWRARALQGAATGPWSNMSRFRTRIQSFRSGNQVYDALTGTTVANLSNRIAFFGTNDPNPGAKLDDDESYLGYGITALTEGEVSFVARRVKPEQNGIIFSMQDGTGTFAGSPSKVSVEKSGSRVIFRFLGGQTETGTSFIDNAPYFFKIEWRGGTARLRVSFGQTEGSTPQVDITTSYAAPYNPSSHTVLLGAIRDRSLTDARLSNLYVGPYPRPVP
jgi:hypothetical protein